MITLPGSSLALSWRLLNAFYDRPYGIDNRLTANKITRWLSARSVFRSSHSPNNVPLTEVWMNIDSFSPLFFFFFFQLRRRQWPRARRPRRPPGRRVRRAPLRGVQPGPRPPEPAVAAPGVFPIQGGHSGFDFTKLTFADFCALSLLPIK